MTQAPASASVSSGPLDRVVATADGLISGLLRHPSVPVSGAPLLVCVHGSGCSGRYFDLAGNSLATTAAARGSPVLMLDRPGYGESAPPGPGSATEHGIAAIDRLVDVVRATDSDLAHRPLALVGHSFGGAIALAYAASAKRIAPVAVCVSGIGDRPDPRYAAARTAGSPGSAASPSPYWLFGPGSTYDWRGVTALRAAAAPWRAEEVEEVVVAWPARWAAVAAAIACPVQIRLAEFERIWEATPESIERIAAAFTHAPRIDAAIAPDGGHLYEMHLRGPELVEAQLDFIRDNAAAAA